MKTFDLVAKLTISVSTSVEAKTLEEAIEIANERKDILHGHFQHGDINEHWVVDEYDGIPYDIKED